MPAVWIQYGRLRPFSFSELQGEGDDAGKMQSMRGGRKQLHVRIMIPLEKKFIPESCFALLFIEKPEIPDRIRRVADERGLTEKYETHISVVVTRNARKLREVISKSGDPEKLKEEIKSLFVGFSWEFSLTDEYFLQEKFYSQKELQEDGHLDLPEHTRRTIIQKVELPDIKIFYKKLSDLLNVPMGVPVPHVTLFSWSDHTPLMMRGIGISSEDDFENYSRGKL